jgi:Tfp pilus assembly protein PilV
VSDGPQTSSLTGHRSVKRDDRPTIWCDIDAQTGVTSRGTNKLIRSLLERIGVSGRVGEPTGLARLRREEDGITLVELLITIVVSLVVFAGTLQLVIVGMHQQRSAQNKVTELQQSQVAMARIVRDLRQATSVSVVSALEVTYSQPATSGTQSVDLKCSTSTGKCTRTIGASSTTAISNVTNSDIFTGSPNNTSPTYIGIKLTISATNHSAITLNDGVDIRNSTLGS